MYDLLKEWPELEQLKQQNWKIDSSYNHEENKYRFSLKRYCYNNEDEIFSFEIMFRQLHSKWYCYVYIEQFFASSLNDFKIAMEVLKVIENKINEIKAIMDDKDIIENIGRC